jgi:hypothetical protein
MEAPQGPAPAMPALTELTAYRIVQEALTNTHKHAGRQATAQVRIALTPAAVRITIHDDGGRGPARTGLGTGHGMIGMQERVKAAGGTFTALPRPTGGFRVEAELPIPGAARPAADTATGTAAGAEPTPGLASTDTAARTHASMTDTAASPAISPAAAATPTQNTPSTGAASTRLAADAAATTVPAVTDLPTGSATSSPATGAAA